MSYDHARYRRWYLKLKADPARYECRLEYCQGWNRAYRKRRSPKYLRLLLRRRMRNDQNPFPHREDCQRAYQKLKKSPAAYEAFLEKQRTRYKERMVRLRQEPAAYRFFLNARMVYHRYHRILKKEEARVAA